MLKITFIKKAEEVSQEQVQEALAKLKDKLQERKKSKKSKIGGEALTKRSKKFTENRKRNLDKKKLMSKKPAQKLMSKVKKIQQPKKSVK